MKKRFIRIAAVGLCVLIVGFLIVRKLDLFGNDSEEQAVQGPPVVPVEAVVVQPILLQEKILATGSLLPDEEVEISSEASGKVTSIHFQEGSFVSQGQLLVKLNDADLRAQLERVQHQIALAEQTESRQGQLLQKEAISQEEYERSATEVFTLDAEADLIRAQIAKTEIRAPFSGKIGLRTISQGSYISPGMSIAKLVKYQPIKIDFTIPGKYASFVRAGDTIYFSSENNANENMGTVVATQPLIDQNTRTLQVRAVYPNEGLEVIPGSFAEVALVLDQIPNAIVIPAQALISEMGGQKVYLVKNGQLVETKVNTGIRTEDQVEITFGLAPNDTVITSGLMQLRPGVQINITKVENTEQP